MCALINVFVCITRFFLLFLLLIYICTLVCTLWPQITHLLQNTHPHRYIHTLAEIYSLSYTRTHQRRTLVCAWQFPLPLPLNFQLSCFCYVLLHAPQRLSNAFNACLCTAKIIVNWFSAYAHLLTHLLTILAYFAHNTYDALLLAF